MLPFLILVQLMAAGVAIGAALTAMPSGEIGPWAFGLIAVSLLASLCATVALFFIEPEVWP